MKIVSEPGPRWQARRTGLMVAAHTAGLKIIEQKISEAQAIAKQHTPVYEPQPPGEVLVKPPLRREFFGQYSSSGSRGDEWFRTVVKTLSDEYGLRIPDPRPGVLLEAVARTYDPKMFGNVTVVGFASRADLDEATRYDLRLILRGHVPTPADRGQDSVDPERAATHAPRSQLLWYNWDTNRWQSASVLARPDGSTEPLGGLSFGSVGNWRGALRPGSGYWEEQEFGTMLRQIDPQYLPGPDDNLVMIHLSRGNLAVTELKPRGDGIGIHPGLFLTRAAVYVVQHLFNDPQVAEAFRSEVKQAMSHG